MRFVVAIQRLLENEGGYSNHPADKGGETYQGISRISFPKWQGWKIIDLWKKKGQLISGQILSGLEEMVKKLYKDNFWDACRCDDLPECLRMQVFDIAVNSSCNTAGLLLQKAINRVIDKPVIEDGVIGDITCKAAKNEPLIINAHIFALRMDLYWKIVCSNESQKIFRKGWYLRAMKVALSQ